MVDSGKHTKCVSVVIMKFLVHVLDLLARSCVLLSHQYGKMYQNVTQYSFVNRLILLNWCILECMKSAFEFLAIKK